MAEIPVRIVPDSEPERELREQEAGQILRTIQERAWQLFHERGGQPGHELEDWLCAEREILLVPLSELIEEGRRFVVRTAVPGLEAGEIEVEAMPERLFVRGLAHSRRSSRSETRVHFSEFRWQKLFRRYDLPARIDPRKAKARLQDGILEITAPKAAEKPAGRAARASKAGRAA